MYENEGFMSNYEITKKRVQKEFVKYDHSKMVEKFGLEQDEEYVYIDFLCRKYRIHKVEGIVEWVEIPETNSDVNAAGKISASLFDWSLAKEGNFLEVLTIFDVLCDSKEDCYAAREFVSMQSMSSIKGSSANLCGDSPFEKECKVFDKNCSTLAAACEKLNGVKKGKGDVSYEIPVFDFLSIIVQFWESDDEFDASLQILVDKNILQFMRYETMWYAVDHMLDRIKEEM